MKMNIADKLIFSTSIKIDLRFYTLKYIHIFIYICMRFPSCDCFSPVILYSIYLEYTILYHYKCI